VKTSEQISRENKAKEIERIKLYRVLSDQAMQMKQEDRRDEQALEASQKALEMNTEVYSLWNHRRTILDSMMKEKTPQEMLEKFKQELQFTERSIRANSKSYWVWLHRRWVVLHTAMAGTINWKHELYLCNKLLSLDARNFHCWSYRRFVDHHGKIPHKEEFDYTTEKIGINFSDYSAWHQRSKLLPLLYEGPALQNAIKNELELVWKAIYTQPEDQSPWIYHRWLIGTAKQIPKEGEYDAQGLIKKELNNALEFLHDEPRSKWPLITTVTLMKDLGGYEEEIKRHVEILGQVDPFRINYYQSLA